MQGLLFGIALGTECYKETSDFSALYKIYSGQTKEYCSGNIQNNESLAESRTYEDLSSALAQQLSDQQFNTFLMINDINHMIVYALHQEYFADGIKQGMLLGSEAIGLISLM